MTITCTVNARRGTAAIIGSNIPDGTATLTRTAPGENPYLLRGGAFNSTSGGFLREDTEASFGKDLLYTLNLALGADKDRLIQRNLILTPTFTHGLQSWSPGIDRTAVTTIDTTSFSKQVGWFSRNTNAVATVDNPSLVGHLDVPHATDTTTLTPPTTGTSGIFTDDALYLVHVQPSGLPDPVIAGFTKVSNRTTAGSTPGGGTGTTGPGAYPSSTTYPSSTLYPGATGGGGGGSTGGSNLTVSIWSRRRADDDTSYTVVQDPTALSATLTLLWVRNASVSFAPVIGVFTQSNPPGTGSTMVIAGVTVPRPSLVLTIAATDHAQPGVTNTALTNTTVSHRVTDAVLAGTRNLVIGSRVSANATTTAAVTASYSNTVVNGVGIQIGLQANISMANRVVGSVRTAAIPIPASGRPYLMTGRFKYRTSDLWLWEDVRNSGTWSQLKASKTNWNNVKSQANVAGDDYLTLFVNIVSASGNTLYLAPVQVLTVNASTTNAWVEFNFFFTPLVDIPAGSKIQLFHGSALRESAVEWMFDRFGITSGDEIATRNVLDWFDGDSVVPYSPEDNLFPSGEWDAASDDARIMWDGTPGNSISRYTGPSKIKASTRCIIDTPDLGSKVCEPVYLSDPITPPRGQWYSLMRIDPLSYAARQSIINIINRAAAIAVSQQRAWASGTITLMTTTLGERQLAEQTFETGRILLFRNPNPEYPENGWYLAVGDVTESRLVNDHRRPERLWTIPFVRVERPSGLIDTSIGQSWSQLKTQGMSWGGVRNNYVNWLDVLTEPVYGALGFGLENYVPPASDYVPPTPPANLAIAGSAAAYSSTFGILQSRFGGQAGSLSTTSGTIKLTQTFSGSISSISTTSGTLGSVNPAVIDGGSASGSGTPDVVDGGTAGTASGTTIDGNIP